eukprot:1236130-Amorphochlora_amoeboformis.AAC.1
MQTLKSEQIVNNGNPSAMRFDSPQPITLYARNHSDHPRYRCPADIRHSQRFWQRLSILCPTHDRKL